MNEIKENIFQIQRDIGSVRYPDWSKLDKRTLAGFDVKAKILPIYARKVPENGVIVEIGSYMGASTIILGLTSKESVRVYCIETKIQPQLPLNIKKYKLSGKVFILPGASVNIAKRWKLPINLLFIDGNHSYKNEMLDNEKWIPFLKKNGIVIWHDYDYPLFDCFNVKLVVDDFMKVHNEFKKIYTEPSIFVAEKYV